MKPSKRGLLCIFLCSIYQNVCSRCSIKSSSLNPLSEKTVDKEETSKTKETKGANLFKGDWKRKGEEGRGTLKQSPRFGLL